MEPDNDLIRKIFIFEGWLISIIGAVTGIILGFIICWLQQTFGIVKLQSETLIMDSYPVVMKVKDFIIVPVNSAADRILGSMVSGKVSYKEIPE